MAEKKDGPWFDVEVQQDTMSPEATKDQTKELPESQENQALKDDGEPEIGKRVQKRIDKLTKRAKTAEEVAAAREAEVAALREKLAEAEHKAAKATVESASPIKSALKDKIALLEAQLENAYDSADKAALVRTISELTDARFEYKALEAWQAENKVPEKPTPKPEQARDAKRPETMPEAARDWFSANPWFGFNGRGKDTTASRVAHGISEDLLAEGGWDPEDPEFYEELDRRLGEELPRMRKDQQDEEEAQVRRNPVARASRVPADNRRSNRVRLSEGEVETARRLGIPVTEYARHKVELEQQGRGYTTIKLGKE